MKKKYFFSSAFFLALGVIWLIGKTNLITNWDFIPSLYPIVLVFWGLLVLTKNTIVKPIISASFGAFLALLIYGTAANLFGFFDNDFKFRYPDSDQSSYSFPYNQDIKYSYFELNTGATAFEINSNTDSLIMATAYGNFLDYSLTTNITDSLAKVYFSNNGDNNITFGKKHHNKVTISLNANPIWDINLNYGAAKGNIDLSNLKIQNLSVHTGATSTTIKLGDNFNTKLNIDMGVSSITIKVPSTLGVKVYGSLDLSKKEFKDFKKIDDGSYINSTYDTSKNKLEIRANGALSKFKIVNY